MGFGVQIHSSPPSSMGGDVQDPQWMPVTSDSTGSYTRCGFLYVHP